MSGVGNPYINPGYVSISYTAGVNATVPVQGLVGLNTGLGANVDVSIVPAGTGALQLSVPDGTSAGGSKRGANAADFQMVRNGASQVASGAGSFIAAGNGNTASGQYAIAGGQSSVASGAQAVAFGSSGTASGTNSAVLGGGNSIASGTASTTLGSQATTNGISGQVAFGHNSGTNGRNQRTFTQLWNTIGANTTLTLTADAASGATSNQLTLRNNTAYRVRLYAVARDNTNATDAKEWTADILMIRGSTAASTAIVGSPTVTSTFATSGASTWTLAIAADTTNGALKVTLTNGTTDTLHANCQLDAIEVL